MDSIGSGYRQRLIAFVPKIAKVHSVGNPSTGPQHLSLSRAPWPRPAPSKPPHPLSLHTRTSSSALRASHAPRSTPCCSSSAASCVPSASARAADASWRASAAFPSAAAPASLASRSFLSAPAATGRRGEASGRVFRNGNMEGRGSRCAGVKRGRWQPWEQRVGVMRWGGKGEDNWGAGEKRATWGGNGEGNMEREKGGQRGPGTGSVYLCSGGGGGVTQVNTKGSRSTNRLRSVMAACLHAQGKRALSEEREGTPEQPTWVHLSLSAVRMLARSSLEPIHGRSACSACTCGRAATSASMSDMQQHNGSSRVEKVSGKARQIPPTCQDHSSDHRIRCRQSMIQNVVQPHPRPTPHTSSLAASCRSD
eukprot:349926-Chlamydomonas_euryale.AAC.3